MVDSILSTLDAGSDKRNPIGGGLEYGLLVPREPRGFKEVDGWIEPVNSSSVASINPVVTVNIPYANFVGLKSGRRSGLLSVEEALKVKGCRISSALKAEGPYTVRHIFPNGSTGIYPEGGSTLSVVEREISNTLFINELLIAEGFPVPYEPKAIMHYGVMFNPDGADCAEELAASVMGVKGDTRLAELYRLKPADIKAARRVANRLGVISGVQKRVTNGLYWANSESAGNYVVFSEGNQLHSAPVDFEDTLPYEDVDIPEELKYLSTRDHILDFPGWLHGLKELKLSAAPDLERRSIAKMFGSMQRSSLLFVEGRYSRPTAQNTAPWYFREEFKKGFKEGYKNPDKREPITLDMLVEAFDLSHISSN